ncbi:ATP-dependent zinc metalloprotease FtsH [compost metagenome]
MTRPELLNKMSILLGGRVAESLVFGEISTGAADDLVKVTNIAEALVTKYGMTQTLGNVVFELHSNTFLENAYGRAASREISEESANLIDHEIKIFIEDATKVTRKLLEEHRDILEKGAQLLLEKETLSEEEIKTLMVGILPEEEPPTLSH